MAGRSASVYPALWNEALQSGKTGKGEALRRNLYLSNNAKRFSRVKRFVLIVRRHHSEALPAEPLVSAEALPFEPQEGSASFGEMGAPRPDLERGNASGRRIFFRSIPMAQKGKRFPPGRAGDDSKDTGLEKSFTQTEAFPPARVGAGDNLENANRLPHLFRTKRFNPQYSLQRSAPKGKADGSGRRHFLFNKALRSEQLKRKGALPPVSCANGSASVGKPLPSLGPVKA